MLVWHPQHASAVICSFTLLLAGCDGDTTTDPAAAYREAPRLMLVEEFRFCRDETAPGCQLGAHTSVNLASGGGVFIWSESGPVVRFDTTGAPSRQYGRVGEGPGEYQAVVGVHQEPDGRVVLTDFGRPRRLVFALDGTPLATHRDTPDLGRRDMRPDPRGFIVLSDPPGEAGDSVQSEFQLFRDTMPPVIVATIPLTRLRSSSGFMRMPDFFANTLRWAIESDSTAIAATGPTLLVTRHFHNGRSVRVVDVPPIGNRPVTPEQLEAERERRAPQGPVPPDLREALQRLNAEAEARAPEIHQFAGALRSLLDGTFVLQELEVQADSARWTLFSHDGEPLGQFRLAARAQVVSGTRERLLLVSPDDREVPIVAWYRVTAVAR